MRHPKRPTPSNYCHPDETMRFAAGLLIVVLLLAALAAAIEAVAR